MTCIRVCQSGSFTPVIQDKRQAQAVFTPKVKHPAFGGACIVYDVDSVKSSAAIVYHGQRLRAEVNLKKEKYCTVPPGHTLIRCIFNPDAGKPSTTKVAEKLCKTKKTTPPSQQPSQDEVRNRKKPQSK